MKLTRRDLFRTGAAVGGIAAFGSMIAGAAAPALAWAQQTTLGSVLLRGPAGAGGYRKVVTGPGEPHLTRNDLGAPDQPGRAERRQAVLAFAQMSDIHIVDAQSPMRLEFLDRFDDQDQPGDPIAGLFSSAYRPQEIMSAHVAEAMVREINAIKFGPVTGSPLAFAIQTGDNSDNSQRNEIRWNIDLLDGKWVTPDSGNLTRYEGVADGNALYYDTHYWHPHGTPFLRQKDIPRSRYGFPTVPGLLDAVRRPFKAAGVAMPWYSAFGNHDGLSQGNFPHTFQLNTVAVGGLKIVSPPAGISIADLLNLLRGNLPGLLQALALTPAVRQVSRDPNRRLLTRKQIVEEHFNTTGLPVGHGFTPENRTKGTAYYTFDQGTNVRFIVLDTVNPNGYSNGSLDSTQFAWLKARLAEATDKLVIVCSHHTADTMDNPLVLAGGDLDTRVLGAAVVTELLAHESVIAWVNGHTHTNQVWAHTRPGGGGFWEINTASHIDWPQQSRLIEIVDNQDGSLSIFATMLDHAAPLQNQDTSNVIQLAALSRELSANDWNERDHDRRGVLGARNVELLVKTPAFMA
ncbi:TIGR03767 family metallophosphoesterase [Nocardioides sp.]|uniref:TIGR03767 family metallophosphoesterase n=1 Tax=Nocardioides sp. TaxID=35761 RepID=UPI0031FE4C7E|nr:hypothetical protein [Nocardioides sp.]